jgi:hypothetical protein
MLRWKSYPIVSHKWYTARVRIRGNHVESSLFDDGKEVVHLAADDVKHPRGRVGFATWHASYKFRNIRVTAPDGTGLWDGPPPIRP